MNEDVNAIFEKYVLVLEQEQQSQVQSEGKPLGQLVGAKGGGEGGDWGGSMPKLISLLPFGIWKPSSLKRARLSTRSGGISDHYEGNSIAYAADFGLNTTFGTRVEDATRFAIAVARNAGANVSSWEPFKGNYFNHETPDGYRVQIIWLSNVGGNHYDHVHVGVKKGRSSAKFKGAAAAPLIKAKAKTDAETNQQTDQQFFTKDPEGKEPSPYLNQLNQMLQGGFTKEKGIEPLQGIVGNAKADVERIVGKKLF
jgi:hypothetical protein